MKFMYANENTHVIKQKKPSNTRTLTVEKNETVCINKNG